MVTKIVYYQCDLCKTVHKREVDAIQCNKQPGVPKYQVGQTFLIKTNIKGTVVKAWMVGSRITLPSGALKFIHTSGMYEVDCEDGCTETVNEDYAELVDKRWPYREDSTLYEKLRLVDDLMLYISHEIPLDKFTSYELSMSFKRRAQSARKDLSIYSAGPFLKTEIWKLILHLFDISDRVGTNSISPDAVFETVLIVLKRMNKERLENDQLPIFVE